MNGAPREKNDAKSPQGWRVVRIDPDMVEPDEFGETFTPEVSGVISKFNDAFQFVRDDILQRVKAQGLGIEWNHTEEWDSGEERWCDDPCAPFRCRVYNRAEGDIYGKDDSKKELAMIYWILHSGGDGSAGMHFEVDWRDYNDKQEEKK